MGLAARRLRVLVGGSGESAGVGRLVRVWRRRSVRFVGLGEGGVMQGFWAIIMSLGFIE